jgi:hypothetical protein
MKESSDSSAMYEINAKGEKKTSPNTMHKGMSSKISEGSFLYDIRKRKYPGINMTVEEIMNIFSHKGVFIKFILYCKKTIIVTTR